MLELLPDELRQEIPALYAQEKIGMKEKIVYAKFFFPAGRWTWFVTEGKQHNGDYIFFGYVVGFEEEWGYFTLNELQNINVKGLIVERDLYFKPGKFCDVLDRFRKECGQ